MAKTELDKLAILQDIEAMLQDVDEVKELGFEVSGHDSLMEAKDAAEADISKPLLSTYRRLKRKYKRAIAHVHNETCLGCFVRLPTSVTLKGRTNEQIMSCENCGRILYWID